MVAEVRIHKPSIARFRLMLVEKRLPVAHIEPLTLQIASDGALTEALESHLTTDAVFDVIPSISNKRAQPFAITMKEDGPGYGLAHAPGITHAHGRNPELAWRGVQH